jgi:integrase
VETGRLRRTRRSSVSNRVDRTTPSPFRHARISELLQVYGVDPLTVAAQTGTSLRMIERTYFKFIRSAMLEKLANLEGKLDAEDQAPL